MTIQQQVHITRQQCDAASAVEREAYNALVRATNAYCASVQTQHDYDVMERRFKRTKAGAALVATWQEAKRVQDAAIKANMAALNQFWLGFGLIMGTTSLAHMFNHGEQETELYQHVEAAILADYPPVQPAPTVAEETAIAEQTTPIEELSNLHDTLDYFRRQAAKGHAAFANRVSEIEAQIATLEADVLADYPAQPAAPVVEAAQTDIVTRLEDAAEIYSHLCDCDTDLYQEAAAEIRRLQAALNAALSGQREAETDAANLRTELAKERSAHALTDTALKDLLDGEPIINVRYDADYEPSPWVWSVRRMERSIQNNAKTREVAEQYAKQIAESIRRQNAR